MTIRDQMVPPSRHDACFLVKNKPRGASPRRDYA